MISNNLTKFSPISLKEMDNVSLLKRVDTKFLTTEKKLVEILTLISSEYNVLDIENKRLMKYSTLYFDSNDKILYKHHHNKKGNRHKIRMRKYVDSNICFLEVKKKNNTGFTNKFRCPIDNFETKLSPSSLKFIKKYSDSSQILHPVLSNTFSRFTLVNKNVPERVTIDTRIVFKSNNVSKILDKIVVIEVKQEKGKENTAIYKVLKTCKISNVSFSKYCIGISNLIPSIKSNQFKEINLKLNKLHN
ncbi:polyphosphate polymerase domain-containing protein [Flavobacteriaceae bacterium]|nr:polyphosphate polymerase domain-containing protein [Flavobacteriaceae bacterium]